MSNYTVRCTITRSISIEAESEEQAIAEAPDHENSEDWDSNEVEYEADVVDEDEE
jgi:hypothetical protein